MAETLTVRLWAGRGIFLVIAATIMFARLLPFGANPGGWPSPDLLICLTFAWVLRRPEHVPPLTVVAVFLLADMLFLRTPGLWTLLMLAATEFLRARQGLTRELPFPIEWAMIAAVLLVATLAETLALTLLMVPKTAAGVALLTSLMTLLAYPAVVAALWLSLSLRRAAPGEVDRLGRRI